jgi:hypothetical protein
VGLPDDTRNTFPSAVVTVFRSPSGLPLRAGMNFAVLVSP